MQKKGKAYAKIAHLVFYRHAKCQTEKTKKAIILPTHY